MIKRTDIKGFTLNLKLFYLDVVYYKYFFNLKSISFRKKLHTKSFYFLDIPINKRWNK